MMMNKVFILLLTADLVSAGNRPGSGGGCDGVAPNRPFRPPQNAGDTPVVPGRPVTPVVPGRPEQRRMTFNRDVAKPATLRALQNRPGDNETPFAPSMLTEEDIALCCSGNGDFEFLLRDLDFDGLAIATEADGFKRIPGDSRWSCRRECRDPLNGFELDPCYDACDCRQNCPTSTDFLTTDCKSQCNSPDPDTFDLCLETCEAQCGERCRSTFNGYIVPLDLYAEGLEMLDCQFGDLIGDATGSCNSGQAFWEASGYTCQVTEGTDFDCECDVPGTCLNVVYPCDYQFYCVSNSPTDAPSREPTRSPTPRPTRGKGKGSSSTSSKKDRRRDRVRGRD
ncbi:unnamed protein product [Cylindrotheca closterium]|uniref:Uncharacterized protein n=1 Tax=Cylindrotheca closterium TaxID=2856 RepID=A0AAD2CUP9_9STRA|nr:unnamed protein product [Cylindrotheca closterium]